MYVRMFVCVRVQATAGIKMKLLFPYKNRGAAGFSDFDSHRTATYQPTLTNKQNDALAKDETFNFFLTKGVAYMPELWFADYRPKIESVFPPFGPEEGGTIVTITGKNFPMGRSDFNSNGSVVFEHSAVNPGGVGSSGGDERECCETWRLNSSQIMCRLPRTSCLTQVIGFACPQPGLYFTNQTVSFAVKPSVKGFDGLAEAASIDRFIQYEGIWEIVDEDIYGGIYVPIKDRAPGEAHILNADNSVARESCCPVCPPGIPEADRAAQCRLTITQSQNGVYDVTVPETLTPGNAIRSGACDAATNYLNTTLRMTIETSVDPKGFTPKAPLSITNCPAGTGGIVTEACASVPRVSIRESCKQLIWSTGNPNSYLPPGETQEVHEWITNSQCDRRLRCVGGACMWSKLATNNDGTNWAEPPPPGYKTPVFQRRKSSAQIGLAVETNQPFFDSDGFMEKLGSLINATEKGRIQILNGNSGMEVQTDLLGTTFAVRSPCPRLFSYPIASHHPDLYFCSHTRTLDLCLAVQALFSRRCQDQTSIVGARVCVFACARVCVFQGLKSIRQVRGRRSEGEEQEEGGRRDGEEEGGGIRGGQGGRRVPARIKLRRWRWRDKPPPWHWQTRHWVNSRDWGPETRTSWPRSRLHSSLNSRSRPCVLPWRRG